MLVGAVIDHQIHDDTDAAFLRFCDQLIHVLVRSKGFIYMIIICNIVTVIVHRGFINRTEPDHICPEVTDIVQFFNNTAQIADPIPIRIIKAAGVNLINDCLFPPLFFFHEQNPLFLIR